MEKKRNKKNKKEEKDSEKEEKSRKKISTKKNKKEESSYEVGKSSEEEKKDNDEDSSKTELKNSSDEAEQSWKSKRSQLKKIHTDNSEEARDEKKKKKKKKNKNKNKDKVEDNDEVEMEDVKPEALNVYNFVSGDKIINASKVPGCGVFVMQRNEKEVPRSFEMFVEMFHCVPQVLVFLKIVKRYSPVVMEDKRYKVEVHSRNIYVLNVYIGFSEHDVPLIDIVDRALSEVNVTEMKVTVYHASEIIRIVNKRCSNIFYYIYGSMKEMFPTTLNGVTVEPDHLVILNFICPL